ncbi:hypothetical protein BJ944DRAFT_267728 [Cunninghamella echinulata]|nr:hypothetical protein BJ944DRAFT_267728 [Cunninghamella echinulata]
MKDLPCEIITNILLYLPPKYIAECSLINKAFYTITREPIIYRSVELSTQEQMEKFISMAKTITTHGKTVGYWVQQLNIDKLQTYEVEVQRYIELRHTCPNALFLGYKQLPSIPLHDYLQSTSDNDNNNGGTNNKLWSKLTSLQLDVMSEIKSDKGILKYQTDEEQLQRKRNIKRLFRSNATEIHDLDSNNRYHPFYYGKILQFSSLLSFFPPTFYNLKELHLQFHSFDHQQPLPEMYELDERSIDSILLSCPNIEVLKLFKFFMNYRCDPKSTDISPYTSLKSLYLDDCIITEPENFSYFSSKFPSISTLYIHLNSDFESNINDKSEFILAIQEMISSFTNLYHLTYSSSVVLRMGKQLVTWLMTSSKSINSLGFDLGIRNHGFHVVVECQFADII